MIPAVTNAAADRDPLTGNVIGAAIEVHKALGPGLLESVYDACLRHEPLWRDIKFRSQVALSVVYRDVRLDCGYRLDLIVEESLIVECKAVESLLPIHQAQLLTYL
jgi:GxxExxY protein